MGLFTTTDDKHLEEAKKHVSPSDMVCPSCKAPLSISAATLVAFNAALGIEGHKCPGCGHMISRRRASPDGL